MPLWLQIIILVGVMLTLYFLWFFLSKKYRCGRMLRRGRLLFRRGYVDEAEHLFANLLDYAIEKKITVGQQGALVGLAEIYSLRGLYGKALEYYNKTLGMFQEGADLETQATILSDIGVLYWRKGDLEESMRYLGRALEINTQLEYQIGIGYNIGNMGLVYMNRGEVQKALETFQKALEIAEETNDLSQKANQLGNIGSAYKELRVYKKALDYLNRSLRLFTKLRLAEGIARQIGSIATVYCDMGLFNEGLVYLRGVRIIFQQMGVQPLVDQTDYNIAMIEEELSKQNP